MDLVVLAQDVNYDGLTGDTTHLRELVRHLALRGHTARVIARANQRVHGITYRGVELHGVASESLWFSPLRKFLMMRELLRVVADRRPHLMYSRGFGDLLEGLASRDLGLPLVLEVNGDAIAERESMRGRPYREPLRGFVEATVAAGFRLASAVICVTETLRAEVIREFGTSPAKVRVVPNGVDAELFRPTDAAEAASELGLPSGPKVVFVGALEPWQGVGFLIQAFRNLVEHTPEAMLIIVGRGQEEPALRSLVETLGIRSKVLFEGFVPHRQVPLYVSAADACVAPMTRERLRSGSSAIKIHEYLACGRPVIASRIPGLEFLEEQDIGRLVPPEDGGALAEELADVLSDGKWRVDAGVRARSYAVDRCSWRSVAASVEAVCQEAMAS